MYDLSNIALISWLNLAKYLDITSKHNQNNMLLPCGDMLGLRDGDNLFIL